jgi:hypothetical protein
MSRNTTTTTLIELPTGAGISATCKVTTDWPSVRLMVESGVPIPEAAALFKLTESTVRGRSVKEQWLTPSRVDKLRKKLAGMQKEVYDRTGRTQSVVDLKAALWTERSEAWKERMAEVVEASLKTAKIKVKSANDLKAIQEVARTLTGEAQSEDNAPKLAVSIGFLRSGNGPRPVEIEAEVLEG